MKFKNIVYYIFFLLYFSSNLHGQFIVDLGADKQLCYGEKIILDAGIASANYIWSTGETTKTIEVTTSGIYSVSVSFEITEVTDEIIISFNPIEENFVIPNVFTPNNDEVNDVFYPVTEEKKIAEYELSVFNRLGQRLFFSETPYIGWDGRTLSGESASKGTYYYIITYSPICDKGSIKGSITLK
jgi:gliding motility-associated-like protein